jgi:hypothetical protein
MECVGDDEACFVMAPAPHLGAQPVAATNTASVAMPTIVEPVSPQRARRALAARRFSV